MSPRYLSHLLTPVLLAWALLSPATITLEDNGTPEDNGVESRAGRIRQLVDQLPNPATPRRTIPATEVSLNVHDTPLAEVLREIEKQTGNKTVDERQSGGRGSTQLDPHVTLLLEHAPFWLAMDSLLDATNATAANQSGSDSLAITERPRNASPRAGSAAYAGPFRIQPIEIQAQRNLRDTRSRSLKIQLEIAWEPRLNPLAISQPAGEVIGATDTTAPLTPSYPEAVFTAEVPLGTQAIDMTLPFELPHRHTAKITSLRGKLRALVPGRQARFEFADLAHAAGKSQRIADTEVIVDDVRKNNEIWEIHMRLKLDPRNPALDRQRGWAFDNRSYLLDAQGEPIENAGFETTSEAEHEVGVAYFFDVADNLDGLTWVYETPADIAESEVEFELKDIELP